MDDLNDNFLNNIDLSQLTVEDLVNLGFNEDDLTLTDSDIDDIKKEISNNEQTGLLLQEDNIKKDIVDSISLIQNEQPSYSDLYSFINKEVTTPKYFDKNISDEPIIIKKDEFIHMKKHVDRSKSWYKWKGRKKNFYKPRRRAIEGVRIYSLRTRKDNLSLYNIRQPNYSRPYITFGNCLYKDIPSDAETLFYHNSIEKIKIIKNEVKPVEEKDTDKYFYIFDQKFSLNQEKNKALKKYIGKVYILAQKINEVKIYQSIIDKWNVNPLYISRQAPSKEAINTTKFIDKNFSENSIKFRKKIKLNKPFLTIIPHYRIKKISSKYEDRHIKYEVKKTNILYNKKFLSENDIINALNLYKNCHKAAGYLQVSYNTFKKYARMYNIDTSQYWKQYLIDCKNKIIEPNVKPGNKQKKFHRYIFKHIHIIKPHDVRGINDSINRDYLVKRKEFETTIKSIINNNNNIELQSYNGPYLTNIEHLKDTILYKMKNDLVNLKSKENKCEICGCLETSDNLLLLNLIDCNINNLSFDNIKIVCYNCFILNNYLSNKNDILTPDIYYVRKLYDE